MEETHALNQLHYQSIDSQRQERLCNDDQGSYSKYYYSLDWLIDIQKVTKKRPAFISLKNLNSKSLIDAMKNLAVNDDDLDNIFFIP